MKCHNLVSINAPPHSERSVSMLHLIVRVGLALGWDWSEETMFTA